MSYRPTVRYASHQEKYIHQLFDLTKIDRAKIIRCALHVAAHQPEFYRQLNIDAPPSPAWELGEPLHWKELLTDEAIKQIEEKGGVSHGESQVSEREKTGELGSGHDHTGTEAQEVKRVYTGGIKLRL